MCDWRALWLYLEFRVFFVGFVERIQLLVQKLEILIGLGFAHGHSVADEKLQEVMQQFHNLPVEIFELFS